MPGEVIYLTLSSDFKINIKEGINSIKHKSIFLTNIPQNGLLLTCKIGVAKYLNCK